MNRVFLVGNLTKDPELSTTSNGLSVCKFTVAVTRRFNNADGSREADFLPIICWRGQAENCGRYLRKGSKVAVSGSIQIRNYVGEDGVKRFVTEVIADEVQFLSSKNEQSEEVAELPEVKSSGRINDLKAIDDDGDLPF